MGQQSVGVGAGAAGLKGWDEKQSREELRNRSIPYSVQEALGVPSTTAKPFLETSLEAPGSMLCLTGSQVGQSSEIPGRKPVF